MTLDTPTLSPDEKSLLKEEIIKVWGEFPQDMKNFIIEAQKEQINALYMIQNWAKENGNELILDLITRKILCKEDKLQKMETE